MIDEFDHDLFREFERRGWDLKAEGYHRFYEPITTRVIDRLLDSVRASYGTRVLDVGSGPGYVASRAAERGSEAVGIDISEGMVQVARRLHPSVRFEQGDAEHLPYPASSFDAVVGNFSLHHLPSPHRALEEFCRVLVPGGRVGMTNWDEGSRCRLLGLFTDAIQEVGAEPPADLPAGPPMRPSDAAYAAMLKVAGFRDPKVETIVFRHHFASSGELWDGMLGASIRTSALITGQPEPVHAEIRRAFQRLAAEFGGPDGLLVPMSMKLLTGTKR